MWDMTPSRKLLCRSSLSSRVFEFFEPMVASSIGISALSSLLLLLLILEGAPRR